MCSMSSGRCRPGVWMKVLGLRWNWNFLIWQLVALRSLCGWVLTTFAVWVNWEASGDTEDEEVLKGPRDPGEGSGVLLKFKKRQVWSVNSELAKKTLKTWNRTQCWWASHELGQWFGSWVFPTSHMPKVCHQSVTLLVHWGMVEPLRGGTKWQEVWFLEVGWGPILGPQSFFVSFLTTVS